MSLEHIAEMLHPFLKALATIPGKEIKDRITENIFHPLLENNKTIKESSEDDEEELAKQEHYHRHVDGGKLPPKTVLEIKAMLDTKYVFPAFNILIYAQNYILKMASSTESFMLEENRDGLYKLYDFAIQLEPKPEREELTFSQQQLVNKARTFVTMKMKRRAAMREQKNETKNMIRMKRMMGDQIQDQQAEIIKAIQENEESKAIEVKEKTSAPVTPAEPKKTETNKREKKAAEKKEQSSNSSKPSSPGKAQASSDKPSSPASKSEKPASPTKVTAPKEKQNNSPTKKEAVSKTPTSPTKKDKKTSSGLNTAASTAPSSQVTTSTNKDKDGDNVMSISKETKKKDRKRKNKNNGVPQKGDDAHNKRVRFDLSQNKVTEFFKHGKVATRAVKH